MIDSLNLSTDFLRGILLYLQLSVTLIGDQ